MRVRQSKHQEKIYEIIHGTGIHMTAEEVWEKAKLIDSSIGIATVYRQLNNLAAQNKIQRIRDKDQGYIYDGNGKPHHHFYCTSCGQYSDISLEYDGELDHRIELETGSTVSGHRLVFEGICKHCKQNKM